MPEMHPMIQLLLPEIALILGATAVLLGSLIPALRNRSALISLIAIALALWLGARLSILEIKGADTVASLQHGPLVWYARLITLAIGALIIMVNRHVPDDAERGEYFALILFSLAGVSLTAVANNLVVLFLALELVSVPTYILIGLSRRDIAAQEAAGKYFFLGAFAAAITLYGFSFLYGAAGTMTMFGDDSITAHLLKDKSIHDALVLVGLLLSLAGLAFKIAAVPLHFYVADVYQGAAAPITGMLGFVPKFAGFLALIQLLGLTSWKYGDEIFWLLFAMAAVTMLVGNTLALMQHNIKRMLAYSSVAHSGYMLVALLAGPALASGDSAPLRDGLAALLFYMTAYGVMNLGCFAALSFFRKPGTDDPDQSAETTDDIAGSARTHPWATLCLAVCTLGLMGFPLTGGFMGKLYIISSALSAGGESESHTFGSRQMGMYILVVLIALNAAIAAAYYLRILASCYLRKPAAVTPSPCHSLRLSLALCGLIAVALFIRPGVLFDQSKNAIEEIANPTQSHPDSAIATMD